MRWGNIPEAGLPKAADLRANLPTWLLEGFAVDAEAPVAPVAPVGK